MSQKEAHESRKIEEDASHSAAFTADPPQRTGFRARPQRVKMMNVMIRMKVLSRGNGDGDKVNDGYHCCHCDSGWCHLH